MVGVGGNCSEERVTYSGSRVNFKDNDWRAADPAGGTRKRYSDVARTGGQEKGDKKPQPHKSTRAKKGSS